MKCKCGSSKLQALNHDDHDYLVNFINDKWTLVNPQITTFFFSSKSDWKVVCFDCNHHFRIPANSINEFNQPNLNCSEIVLDLDNTLFHVLNEVHDYVPDSYDYMFYHDERSIKFFAQRRPFLQEFINFCIKKYDKINIFTAASEFYAKELVSFLNIPSNKLGYVKTIKDTVNARSIKFDREYMKYMSNSLVVEDKPYVVEGFNNKVIEVKSFEGSTKDQNLKKVIKILKDNAQLSIVKPVLISGIVSQYLKQLNIKFSDMPFELYEKLISLPSSTTDEMKDYMIRSSSFTPYMIIKNNIAEINFLDVNYETYLNLLEIIKPYTQHKILNEKKYNNIIKKKYLKYKKQMNTDF